MSDEPIRVKALKAARDNICVREVAPNSSPEIDIWLRAAQVPVGTPWCAAFVAAMLAAGGFKTRVPKCASVGFLFSYFRKQGWLVERPLRGDVFALNLDDDRWPDHTGFVERVVAVAPGRYLVRTVEGNTSSGAEGSQDDGDGVHVRFRWMASNSALFARVPG